MNTKTNQVWLSPNEAARLLMVSPITVRAWARTGLLPSETTPGGHRRYRPSDVERFRRERERLRRQGPPRILIVDDNQAMSEYLRELLTGLPEAMECETACDGFDAGARLRSFAPDVVLLDLMMPGMDGFEVCRRIKEDPATAAVRVIAMTGHAGAENERKILAAGAEACLIKPIDETRLVALLLERDAGAGETSGA